METDKEQKPSRPNPLKEKMDAFAHGVYTVSRGFPKDEIYGLTSQLRRAALSVILNYIEGYARFGTKEYANFLRISYGSLKESKYLIFFAAREKYMDKKSYENLMSQAEEIGAMLWTGLQKLKNSSK